MKKKQTRFKIGLSLNDLYKQAYRDPLKTFEQWPIWEVQERCLKALNNFRAVNNEHAEWAEFCIESLWENDGIIPLDISEKILSWYIFSENDDIAIRAIEFAIFFRQHRVLKEYWESMISKLIAGRLLKKWNFIELYPKIPHLQVHLLSWFDQLLEDRGERGYDEAAWFKAERALRIIIKAEDATFLGKIQAVISALENRNIFPEEAGNLPHYARASHLAALRETERLLMEY